MVVAMLSACATSSETPNRCVAKDCDADCRSLGFFEGQCDAAGICACEARGGDVFRETDSSRVSNDTDTPTEPDGMETDSATETETHTATTVRDTDSVTAGAPDAGDMDASADTDAESVDGGADASVAVSPDGGAPGLENGTDDDTADGFYRPRKR